MTSIEIPPFVRSIDGLVTPLHGPQPAIDTFCRNARHPMRLPIGSDQFRTPTLFHHQAFDFFLECPSPLDPTGFPLFSLDRFPLCCISLVTPFVLTFFDGMTASFSPYGCPMNSSFFGHGSIGKPLMKECLQYVPLFSVEFSIFHI